MSEATDAKALNNDWSADTTLWGDDFVATIETSGNEAKGEGPHVSAQFALEGQLTSDDTTFSGENRADSADGVHTPEEKSREWATEGVNLVFTLAGSEEIVVEEFNATADAVGESLPAEWEEVN